jgi:hypothetical protein
VQYAAALIDASPARSDIERARTRTGMGGSATACCGIVIAR